MVWQLQTPAIHQQNITCKLFVTVMVCRYWLPLGVYKFDSEAVWPKNSSECSSAFLARSSKLRFSAGVMDLKADELLWLVIQSASSRTNCSRGLKANEICSQEWKSFAWGNPYGNVGLKIEICQVHQNGSVSLCRCVAPERARATCIRHARAERRRFLLRSRIGNWRVLFRNKLFCADSSLWLFTCGRE